MSSRPRSVIPDIKGCFYQYMRFYRIIMRVIKLTLLIAAYKSESVRIIMALKRKEYFRTGQG